MGKPSISLILDRLRALAESARKTHPGPWYDMPCHWGKSGLSRSPTAEEAASTPEGSKSFCSGIGEYKQIADDVLEYEIAAFIAAANPETVLLLLKALQATVACREAEKHAGELPASASWVSVIGSLRAAREEQDSALAALADLPIWRKNPRMWSVTETGQIVPNPSWKDPESEPVTAAPAREPRQEKP